MGKYIAIISIFLAALLAFSPFASAEEFATPATMPILPETETNAIIDTFLGDIASPAQVETLDDGLVHLLMPATLDFFIDPSELLGLGSVYSLDYSIANYGANDIEIKITDAQIFFRNENDFESMPEPFDYTYKSDKKAIYLEVSFSREGMPPIVITDPESPKETRLLIPAGGEPVLMKVSGSASNNPAMDWISGDVKINLSYNVNTIPRVVASPAVATPPVASPGDTGPGEPVGGDGEHAPPEEPQPEEPQREEPEPTATPAVPEPTATPAVPEPTATPAAVPEPESPQPPEATSGVV